MQAEPTSPPTAPKPRLKLHLVSLVIALAVLGAALAAAHASAQNASPLWISEGVGRFFGALLISGIPGVIAYYIAKRSSRVFNIVLSVFLLIALASNVAVVVRSRRAAAEQQAQRAIENLRQASRELSESALKSPGQTGGTGAVSQRADEFNTKIESEASKLSVDGAIILRVTAAANKSVTDDALQVRTATERFLELGGIDAASIKSEQDIANRLDTLDEAAQKNKVLTARIRNMAEEYRAGLVDAGFAEARAVRHRDQFAIGANIPAQLKIIQLRDQAIQADRDLLVLLKKLWGTWSVRDGTIQLQDETIRPRLSAAFDRAYAAEDAEAEAIEAMLKANAGRSGGDK